MGDSDSSDIDAIYTYYRESMFNHHCFNHTNVEEGGSFDTITITCNVFNPKGYVQICVADKMSKMTLGEEDDGRFLIAATQRCPRKRPSFATPWKSTACQNASTRRRNGGP